MKDSKMFQELEGFMGENELPILQVFSYSRLKKTEKPLFEVLTERQSLEGFVERDQKRKDISNLVGSVRKVNTNNYSIIGDFMLAQIWKKEYNLNVYAYNS